MKLNAILPVPSLTSKPGSGTLYSVQLLRFFAAALVVLSHVRTEYGLVRFGDVGVDIFFVISGFIIYYVTKRASPHFFTKRLIRIVPLYWIGTLVLAAVALLAPSVLNNVEFDATRILASLFFIPYWTAETHFHPLLLLGWTLNYEILFYFVFYVAMRISHRFRFVICSGLLIALSVSHGIAEPKSAYFFWSDSYIIEFIYGMSIGLMVERTNFLRKADTPLTIAGIGLALYVFLLYPTTALFPSEAPRFITIGLASLFAVLLVLSSESAIRRLPKRVTSSVVLLGDLSFASYIFHIYVMGVTKRLIGLNLSIYLYSALVLVGTSLVAAVIFFFIERPSRTFLTRLISRRKPTSSTTASAVPNQMPVFPHTRPFVGPDGQ